MLHVNTVLVMFFMFVLECYFSKLLIAESPGSLPTFQFFVPVVLIIYCTFFWTEISCLPIVMVHPSSYNTPNDINGDVLIFGKIQMFLASLFRPGSWGVAMCY